MENETLGVINRRRSVRNFASDVIAQEALALIVKAGQAAPFAAEGSRHFTVVQNRELLEKLNHIAKKTTLMLNIEGLRELGENEKFHGLYHAPTLIILLGSEKTPAPESDCAAAAQNMLIAAESLGIGSCWLYFPLFAFFTPEGNTLRRELQFPMGFKPYASIALGYKGPKHAQPMERKRGEVTYIE